MCWTFTITIKQCGVMALDYNGKEGIATSIGHSPISGLIDPEAGSRNAITESLTNIIWAPLEEGLKSFHFLQTGCGLVKTKVKMHVYTSCRSISEFAINLGINVPTGKDSLSMKQKYPNERCDFSRYRYYFCRRQL